MMLRKEPFSILRRLNPERTKQVSIAGSTLPVATTGGRRSGMLQQSVKQSIKFERE
ncbi:hypothetical protein SV7mr_17970 [Stieleria bergensis]|uniref:Uncharacterized protein n=1 Tax=Stieleria bergensis TaxID=2528025 RepID=A0A517ST38_9BACT|nr:hypothetical protein SV7mr_17970 [Planctomycetes bacterium SV_7m_r]